MHKFHDILEGILFYHPKMNFVKRLKDFTFWNNYSFIFLALDMCLKHHSSEETAI